MIKMVIFCVIAFALTWLPFNTLIVFGDLRPEIWENPNIMYIWFITHYLAMCHTVTNPLIYIWMNNRFRAGFKQVVSDFYKLLQTTLAFLLCYCLCLGCCFNCSRRKYARVALDLNRSKQNRRAPLTSSGSATLYTNNLGTTSKNNTNTMMTSAMNNNNNNNNTTNLTQNSQVGSTNNINDNQPTQLNCNNKASQRNTSSALDAHRPDDKDSSINASHSGAGGAASQFNVDRNDGGRGVGSGAQCLNGLVCMFKRRRENNSASIRDERQTMTGKLSNEGHERPSGGRRDDQHERQDDRRPPETNNRLDMEHPAGLHPNAGTCNANNSQQALGKQTTPEPNKIGKRKRRKKQSHAISLQMTTREFYPNCRLTEAPALAGPIHKCGRHQLEMNNHIISGSDGGASKQSATGSGRWKLKSRRTSGNGKFKRFACKEEPAGQCSDCPACKQKQGQQETREPTNQSRGNGGASGTSGRGAGQQQEEEQQQQRRGQKTSGHGGDLFSKRTEAMDSNKFLVDTRQSSQSTASISAQTYNTSLAISPLNSTGGGDAGSGLNNNSNTSASSFSANGGTGCSGAVATASERDKLTTLTTITPTTTTMTASCSTGERNDCDYSAEDHRQLRETKVKTARYYNEPGALDEVTRRKSSSRSSMWRSLKPDEENDNDNDRVELRSPVSSQSSGSMPAEEVNVILFGGHDNHNQSQKRLRVELQTQSDDAEFSGTEDDLCDVLQAKVATGRGGGQRAAKWSLTRGAQSSHSLELIGRPAMMMGGRQEADHRDDQDDDEEDNDGDDEELETDEDSVDEDELESEYGDEQSPLRRDGATEMRLMGRLKQASQLHQLKRLFKSTGDELYGRWPGPAAPETRKQQANGFIVRPPGLASKQNGGGGSHSPLLLAPRNHYHLQHLRKETTTTTTATTSNFNENATRSGELMGQQLTSTAGVDGKEAGQLAAVVAPKEEDDNNREQYLVSTATSKRTKAPNARALSGSTNDVIRLTSPASMFSASSVSSLARNNRQQMMARLTDDYDHQKQQLKQRIEIV